MRQTRRASLIESASNVATGYAIGVLVQIIAYPMFGISVSLGQDAAIGAVFVAASFVRSFILRRTFEVMRMRGWMP